MRSRFRSVNIVLWVFAAAYVALILPKAETNHSPSDYYFMWAAGATVRGADIENVYDENELPAINAELQRQLNASPSTGTRFHKFPVLTGIEVNFTPLLIASLAVMAGPDFETSYGRFERFASFVFGAGFLALAWALGLPPLAAVTLLFLTTFPSWAYHMSVLVANVSAPLAGGLMLSMAFLKFRRGWAFIVAGLLMTLVAFVKPTMFFAPVLLGIGLLGERRHADLARFGTGAALGTAIAVLLPFVMLGTSVTWVGWLFRVPGSVVGNSWMRTGTMAAKMLGAADAVVIKLSGAVVIAAGAAFFWSTSNRTQSMFHGFHRDAGAAASGALLYLLAGPIVHSHYFLQALPAALIALRPPALHEDRPWHRWLPAAFALFLIGSHPLFKSLGWVKDANHSAITFIGAWILLGLMAMERMKKLKVGKN